MSALRALLPQFTVLAVFLGGLASGQQEGPRRAGTDAEVNKWVARLGSGDYREREEATRKLREMDEALPAVEEALKSPDAEVRQRAALIVGVLRPRAADRALREFLPEAREDRLRGLLERLAARGHPTDAQWQEVFLLARELAARVGRIQGKDGYGPDLDPARLELSKGSPDKVWSRRKVVVAGLDHDLSTLERCVLVSTGPTRYIGRIYHSIVLVRGDMAGSTTITNSIVFCDGKLGPAVGVYHSIILATNRFEGCTTAEANLFQVPEVGRCSVSRDNLYVTRGEVKTTWPENDRFFPERPAPAAPAAAAP